MKANSIMELDTGKVLSSSGAARNTVGSGQTAGWKGSESIHGQTHETTEDRG